MKSLNTKKAFSALMAALTITGTVTASMTVSASAATEQNVYGNVSMNHLPDKLVYQLGESLDLTGATADACGCTEDGMQWDAWDMNLSQFFEVDASAFNNQIPGTYTIYVSCPDCTSPASFTVEVAEAEAYCNIHMNHLPDKLVYQLGETLDLTGATADVCGCSKGGLLWDAWDMDISQFFEVDASAFNNQIPGTYTIYVSCPDCTSPASFTVEVTGTAVQKLYSQDNSAEPETAYPNGDANGDGKTDILDAVLLNKAVLGKAELTEQQLNAVDFNRNSKPDASDVLTLMKYITGVL